MLRKIVPGVLVAVLLVGALAAVGGLAYRAGMAQGLAQEGKIEFVAPPAGAPGFYPHHAVPFFHPFGFFACLGPLFFIFLAFGFMRMLFFRPWGWRHGMMHHGPWGQHGAPPMFDEWHKRAHGESAPPKTEEPGSKLG